jgi:hypothetical protein
LVAETAERGADTLDGGTEGLARTESRLPRQLASELDSHLAEATEATALGQGVGHEVEEPFVVALGELERGQLGCHSVGLCRPSRTWAGPPCAPLEGGNQEPGFGEALEPAAGDVAMDLVGGRDLVGRDGQRLRAGEEERLPEVSVADRVELVHHF